MLAERVERAEAQLIAAGTAPEHRRRGVQRRGFHLLCTRAVLVLDNTE